MKLKVSAFLLIVKIIVLNEVLDVWKELHVATFKDRMISVGRGKHELSVCEWILVLQLPRIDCLGCIRSSIEEIG